MVGWTGTARQETKKKKLNILRMASHVFAVAVFFLLFLTLGTNYCRKIS